MIPIWGTSAILMAPPAALLLNGYVPANSYAAQYLNYEWFHLTKELNNVLTAAGITQNAALDNQLLAAINYLAIATKASTTQYGVVNYIADTAANLASSNPTPAKGQVAYETDNISFKIGDGSTAYNSLTYAYRGLVVAGEPSLGTPHETKYANRTTTLVVNASGNTAGVWSAAVTMTGFCRCESGMVLGERD